ncbi:replication initiation protein, partial [Escherichia coli]|nr:replication initiation protein [Escherichia coli]
MKQKQDIHAGLVSGGATVADNKVITQGNQLIEGSYDINLAEIRLL